MLVSSLSNPTIKQIRTLRERKERDRSGLFFIEGIRLVGEAVQLGAPIESCVVAPELLSSPFGQQQVAELRQRGVPCIEVTAEVFRSISRKDGPQGLGAVMRQRWETLGQVRPGSELCWVALDAVQDPGNLGTILRTSDAVGSAGVILLGPATDPYDPAALRGSMGALFSQRLVRASADEFGQWKRQHGYSVVGTSGEAGSDFRQARYQQPLVLLMGSERLGLPPELAALCDQMVSIPMVGRSDSLNLSVATGVVLYELFYKLAPKAEQR